MAERPPNPRRQLPWKLILGVLCAALVVFCGTVQAVHVHPGGDVSDAGCSLCAAAHVSIALAVPIVLSIEARRVADVPALHEAIRCSRPVASSLYIRPPPADAAFA